jgi:hypothetical protein
MNYTTKILNLCKKTKQLSIVPFAQSFRWCNNKCTFCYLKDYILQEPPSIEQIRIINNNVTNWLNSNIDKIPNDVKFSLSMIGGELYCLNDDYYNEYVKLIDNVNFILKKRDLTIKLFSNLLFKNLNPIINLYKCENVNTIITSYDYKGRFTNDSLVLWLNNVTTLLNKGINLSVETVLTKEFINDFLDRKDPIYDNLLKNFNINFGYSIIIPNSKSQLNNIPSQEQLIRFFKFIYDNYKPTPCINILQYTSTDIGEDNIYSDCAAIQFALPGDTNSKFKIKDGIVELYCDDVLNIASFQNTSSFYKDNDLKNDFICMENNSKIKYYYDNIYGCGNCKFKGYCQQTKLRDCYRTKQYIDWQDKCWMKQVFKYIEDRNNIC